MIAQKAQDMPEKKIRVLQRRLCALAKATPGRSFGLLYDKVCREEVLREAWRRVAAAGGSAGVDGKSIEWLREYGVEKYLEEVRAALVEEKYRPDKIRRAYIPKGDGRKRPLGIPTVTDRVVQTAVKIVIEPLFEADFLPCSYGFRRERSAHDAIREVEACLRRGMVWLVDVDIKSCYDTIPQEPLMELVERRVRDPRVLRLIRWWLKAGILEKGKVTYPELGTPQGGVLSPLLANIYLHEVDKEWQRRGVRIKMIRYADDLVILCHTREDAEREYEHLRKVMQGLQLTLNAEKTRVGPARDGFDFLGFSFRRGNYCRNGRTREVMIKVPRAKAVTGILRKVKEAVKAIPLGESVKEAVKAINCRLRGWANYFYIGNVWPSLKRLVRHAGNQLRLFLRRKYHRKYAQCSERWPDSYFHEVLGLCTVAQLYKRRTAECRA